MVFNATSEVSLDKGSSQSDINKVLNEAALTALTNSGEPEFTFTSEKLEGTFSRGSVDTYDKAEIVTDSGSGVALPSMKDLLPSDIEV